MRSHSIYIARHDEDALAVIIVLTVKKQPISTALQSRKRNMMPATPCSGMTATRRKPVVPDMIYGIPPTDDRPSHARPLPVQNRFRQGSTDRQSDIPSNRPLPDIFRCGMVCLRVQEGPQTAHEVFLGTHEADARCGCFVNEFLPRCSNPVTHELTSVRTMSFSTGMVVT